MNPKRLQEAHWPTPLAKGQWGQAARISDKNGVNNRTGLVNLEALAREHPLVFTIDLECPPTRAGVSAMIPRAFIEWGSDAAPLTAIVDFVKGARIRVVGTYVRVSAFTDTATAGALADVAAAATVENGSGNTSTIPPTLTIIPPALVAHTTDIPVPNWARDVVVYRSDPTIPMTVTLQTSFATAAGVFHYAADEKMAPLRLTGDADQIEITAAADNGYYVIFGLGL